MTALWRLYIFVMLLQSVCLQETTPSMLKNKTKIHLGAIAPFMRTHDKRTFHAAMATAVRLINSNENILDGYELVLHYKDNSVSIYT